MAYFNLSDLDKSIDDLAISINLNPTHWQTNFLLAAYFAKVNNSSMALSCLEMAYICGYNNYDSIYTFTEFQEIKDSAKFSNLVEKYRGSYK